MEAFGVLEEDSRWWDKVVEALVVLVMGVVAVVVVVAVVLVRQKRE